MALYKLITWPLNFIGRFFALAILFLLLGIRAHANVYINLNIDDCANCSLVLNEVLSSKKIDGIQIVLPEKFLKEDSRIQSLYNFQRFTNTKMLYSDSMALQLTALNNNNVISSIFIFNTKNSLVFKSTLRDLNISLLNFYLTFSKTIKLKIDELKDVNIRNVEYADGILGFQDHFNKLYLNDLQTKTSSSISVDSLFINQLYRQYYGNAFDIKYPAIDRILQYSGHMKPSVESYCMWRDEDDVKLLVEYTIRDFSVNKEKDTVIYLDQLLYSYSLKNQKGNFLIKDPSQYLLGGRNMGIRQVFVHNRQPHIYFYNKTDYIGSPETYLASIDFNIDGQGQHIFSINELHKDIRPEGYSKKIG